MSYMVGLLYKTHISAAVLSFTHFETVSNKASPPFELNPLTTPFKESGNNHHRVFDKKGLQKLNILQQVS